MNINCVVLVFYHAGVKYTTTDLKVDSVDLCFCRSSSLLAINAFVMFKNGEKFYDYSKFSGKDKKWLIWRCIFGTIGLTTIIISLRFIPLHLFGIILNTTPFWIALMECCMQNEKLSKIEIVSMIGAFVGVVMILLSKKEDKGESKKSGSQAETILGVILCMICASTSAYIIIATR